MTSTTWVQNAGMDSGTDSDTVLTYAEAAQSSATQSQDARDTANLHKLAAEAAATSATSTAAALTGFDLEAIAATKAVTAVDVFVYDTSKDSDGGAWRKRTQGTSWYNETLNTSTRGSRKEFPAVAVIVAEADTVTIYDGDDPSLPMWMVANRFSGSGYSWIGFNTTSTAKAVSMLNGVLCVGSTDSASNFRPGLAVIDFGADSAVLILEPADPKDLKTISERNVGANLAKLNDVRRLVNSYVRDVAMTVLPDTAIDYATGLPMPTIAVATDGGTSVIQDDGTVDSIADRGGYTIRSVAFDQDNRLYLTHGSDSSANSTVFRLNDVKNASSYSVDSGWTQGDVAYGFTQFSTAAAKSSISLGAVGPTDLNQFYERIVGVADGFVVNSVVTPFLSRVLADYSDPLQDAVNYTTSTYNTGWMNGAIKGAFLSDTDDTDLVGSGELVTNGTFDTDISGWTGSASGVVSYDAGNNRLELTNGAADNGLAYQGITTVVGETYVLTATLTAGTSTVPRIGAGTGNLNASLLHNIGLIQATGDVTLTFVATTTTTYVGISTNTVTLGHDCFVDNISVKLADADRSVNNNGLIVNGTVTRDPVATGADLVAYSGFSASNYLEQPYNSGLDFGTGDFCVMGWANFGAIAGASTAERVMFARGGVNKFYFAKLSGTDGLYFAQTGRGSWVGNVAVSPNVWTHVALVRRGDLFTIAVNGIESESQSFISIDLSLADGETRIGLRSDDLSPFSTSGSGLALWRISATAPTAEQIAKIYNDEKALFQEGAQATLYGTSDIVTALAHDSDTNLLHAGTSDGRSVFQGLRRVSNTTTAVGTAISASNGLVVEE